MKKKFYVVLGFCLLLTVVAFAQENKQFFLYGEEGVFSRPFAFSFENGNGYLEIFFNSMARYWLDPGIGEEEFSQVFQEPYTQTRHGPFNIIHMGNKSMLYLPSREGRVAFVIPLKEVEQGKWPFFCGVKKELFGTGYYIFESDVIKVSSYLTETIGGRQYSYNPGGFSTVVIRHGERWTERYATYTTTWVAGGSGIGESITIKSSLGNTGIILQNGFIAPNNLDLYYQNSRVRKVRVEYADVSEIIEIEDTPNPQIIDLKRNNVDEVTITILDVYPGTKYKDTAISSILFLKKRKMLN